MILTELPADIKSIIAEFSDLVDNYTFQELLQTKKYI